MIKKLFHAIRQSFKEFEIIEDENSGIPHLIILSKQAENHIDISFEQNSGIILCLSKWTHTHPDSIEDTIKVINDFINGKIIVWKVTRPNGYWYSGHYNLDEWEENKDKGDWNYNVIDEPDSNLEKGDRIERFTFNQLIENKIIE